MLFSFGIYTDYLPAIGLKCFRVFILKERESKTGIKCVRQRKEKETEGVQLVDMSSTKNYF